MLTAIPESVLKALPEFPVQHLSFSSVMKWHEDPSAFVRQYVHRQWDFNTSPSAVVGTAVHHALEKLAHATIRGQNTGTLPEFQADALVKFDAIVAGTDETARVTKIDWGKTGSPEKSRASVLDCAQNAWHAFHALLTEWKIVAAEVRYEALNQSDLGIPLPVSSVMDLVVVRHDGSEARVKDYKTVAALSDPEKWDENGKRRAQAGCYFLPGRAALDAAGYAAVPLTGCDFHEIHRGSGGKSGQVTQVLSVPYAGGKESEAVRVWAEMARRAIVGIYGAFFLPEFCPLAFNLSSEYGGADAFKALRDEMESPDHLLLGPVEK